jgi:Arc/MetJ-type ribon-helix-helix transcriptional regulator
MKITLTPELAEIIEKRVRDGDFSSADNAVNSLLSYIIGQEEILGGQALSELRKKIAVGVAQIERGEVSEFDPDEVWEEVERRYAEQQGKRAG